MAAHHATHFPTLLSNQPDTRQPTDSNGRNVGEEQTPTQQVKLQTPISPLSPPTAPPSPPCGRCWNDCQRIEAKRWLEQSSGRQYSRNSDATDEPKCMVSSFLTPRDPGRTRVGYAAQRLTTVAGELTKHLLLHTCLLLFSLTLLLPTASAQLNFTPGSRPIPLTHNCLGELMASFTDATPAYFANRGINRLRQLPYEFDGDEGFATFVAAIPADKKVLVDLTEEDRAECNHVELIHGYSPFSSWGQRSRLRYSVNICKVRTKAMPLREFLVDKDLQNVEFHASGGPLSSAHPDASAQ